MTKSPLDRTKANGFADALRKNTCASSQYSNWPMKAEYLSGYIEGVDARYAGVRHIEDEA